MPFRQPHALYSGKAVGLCYKEAKQLTCWVHVYRLSGAMSAQLIPGAGAAAVAAGTEDAAAAAVTAGIDGVTGVAVGTAVAAGVAVTVVPARAGLDIVAGDIVTGLGL